MHETDEETRRSLTVQYRLHRRPVILHLLLRPRPSINLHKLVLIPCFGAVGEVQVHESVLAGRDNVRHVEHGARIDGHVLGVVGAGERYSGDADGEADDPFEEPHGQYPSSYQSQ